MITRAILSFALGLSGSAALADMRADINTLWSGYVDFCTQAISDPDSLMQDLLRRADQESYAITTTDDGAVIYLTVVEGNSALSLHAGIVGGQTFVSCGSMILDPAIQSLAAFEDLFVNVAIDRLGRDRVSGGRQPRVELYPDRSGGISRSVIDDNYEFFLRGALPIVDTVTFVTVSPHTLQMYLHDVFDGVVAVPGRGPAPDQPRGMP